jgi:hypothetical protein
LPSLPAGKFLFFRRLMRPPEKKIGARADSPYAISGKVRGYYRPEARTSRPIGSAPALTCRPARFSR